MGEAAVQVAVGVAGSLLGAEPVRWGAPAGTRAVGAGEGDQGSQHRPQRPRHPGRLRPQEQVGADPAQPRDQVELADREPSRGPGRGGQGGDPGDQGLVDGGQEAAVAGAVAREGDRDQAEAGQAGEQPGRWPGEGLGGPGGQGQVLVGGPVPALVRVVLVEGAEQQGQAGVALADGVVAPVGRGRVGGLLGGRRHRLGDPRRVGDPGAHLGGHGQGVRRGRGVQQAGAGRGSG